MLKYNSEEGKDEIIEAPACNSHVFAGFMIISCSKYTPQHRNKMWPVI